jgi:plasmid stability protein
MGIDFWEPHMFQILIRDLNENVFAALNARASSHGRSLEEEVHAMLFSAASFSAEEARWISRRWQSRFAGRKMSDSAELLREDRGW